MCSDERSEELHTHSSPVCVTNYPIWTTNECSFLTLVCCQSVRTTLLLFVPHNSRVVWGGGSPLPDPPPLLVPTILTNVVPMWLKWNESTYKSLPNASPSKLGLHFGRYLYGGATPHNLLVPFSVTIVLFYRTWGSCAPPNPPAKAFGHYGAKAPSRCPVVGLRPSWPPARALRAIVWLFLR